MECKIYLNFLASASIASEVKIFIAFVGNWKYFPSAGRRHFLPLVGLGQLTGGAEFLMIMMAIADPSVMVLVVLFTVSPYRSNIELCA